MKHCDIISQLKSLKENSRSFLAPEEPDSIWHHDIEALDAAIKIVREHPTLTKRMKKLENRLKSHNNGKLCCCKRKVSHI